MTLADPAILAEILCIAEERVVARDNTIAHEGRQLQLPQSPVRAHYVKARIKVREYPDGTLAVFHGPRRIARYSVFQEPRLLAWRTVEQNVRFGAPRASDDELAALFEMLELTRHRNHYPGELSLGLARRVALARAFAVNPDLLLLDEPFVSLDAELALRLREELAELVDRRSLMTLLVTHNLDEAIGLADRLLFLSPSQARILAEIPVASPRGIQVPEQRAALRAEIARRLKHSSR